MDTSWAQRVKDLEAAGLTLVAIGEAVGLSTSAISEIKRGATKEPRFSAATKLAALHAQHCPTKAEAA